MKRIFKHPAEPKHGKRYWRSLEEFAATPEFRDKLAREFPQGASELEGDKITRRGFMKFMGASVALAGLTLTGCRRPLLHGVPYTKGVEWQVPGNALHYATAMPRRGGALPLIATTYNGRPTKLEGNPNVPGHNGSTDIFGQAAILDLYDPDRSKVVLKAVDPTKRGGELVAKPQVTADGKTEDVDADKIEGPYIEGTMDAFWEELAIVRHAYQKNGGDGLAILAEPSTSPTRERLRAELGRQFPKLIWAEYDAWASQAPAGAAYDFSKADVIVALDCDFLGATDGTPQSIAGFAAGRRKLGKTQETMSRLYAIEGRFSITGGMADHRLRMPSSAIGAVVTLLAAKLGSGLPTGNSFAAFNDPAVDAWVSALAADLQKAVGRALIVCGSQQPASVHAAVAALNVALGVPASSIFAATTPASSLGDLAEQISQGTVKTLLVLGGNPAFNAPTELGFEEVISQVEQVIRLGLHVDETSAVSTTHVPAAHFLESWGDLRGWDGTYLSQQPLIEPLYNGVSEIELLGFLAGLSSKGFDLVKETFFQHPTDDISGGDANTPAASLWRSYVHDGYRAGTTAFQTPPAPAAPNSAPVRPLQPDEYELSFYLGNIDDGRYANNGWLQELPDSVTKLTWDNALLMSPNTATKLGVNVMPPNGSSADLPDTDFNPRTTDRLPIVSAVPIDPTTAFPMVRLTTPEGRTMELPVLVAPGQHDQTLSLALGYGRTAPRLTQAERDVVTAPLRVAEGAGFNAYQLRTAATPGFVVGVKVEKIDKTYPLAITQEHNSMEGRGLVREATLDKYHDDPAFVQEIGIDKDIPQGEETGYQKFESAYTPPELNSKDFQPDRPAWGMVIDLNTCVGCNTCMVACQAENNIPIVGKFQVIRGREMHWIRIDRYFATDVKDGQPADSKYLEDPQMLFEPMACQQCEAAPCEPVCPVNATVHNEEGLNVMAYNRCIGTRYCANNCPYKVRKFNFFNYNERPIQNVNLGALGNVGELYLGPLAGRDGPLTYKGSPESLMLQKNPNVTVRIRGVMEKCTYCVQRIEEAKITQLRKSNEMGAGSGDITLPTDSFKVACQQACPAEAITFGNMNDPNSKVSILKQDERNYGVLAYLGTRPRTTYLGRVRNPNMAMPGAEHIGHTSEFESESPGPEKNGADKPARPEDVPANTSHAGISSREEEPRV
jgi:molybdopterin-containing oxidoreductase family iron-sulfur binding subunit